MATAETSTGTGSGSQEVGKVLIVYGKVKAISSAGTERVLGPNSPIFAYDRIITESDGKVSIMLNDPAQTQIDIGRMSDIHIDEDVFGGATQDEIADVAAEVEEIQEAILSEDFDPTVELEAAAAGGTGGAGGGIPVPEFDRVTYDGEINSGAETRGIPGDTIDPLPGIDEGAEETSIPTIEADSGEVWEAGLPDGSAPGAYNTTTAGNLTITHSDPGVDATALLEIQDAGGDWVPVTADNTLVVGQYGDLYVDMDGAWRYELTDNTLDHPDNVFDDGDTDRMADDPVMDNFATRVTDTSGDMTDADGIDPTEILTIAVYDDGPSAIDDETTGQEDQTVTYNVMTNNDGTSDTPGADDAILTGAVLQPAYEGTGEVSFAANGEITFDPVPGFAGPKVVIDYTLTGGDQDLANATLTILYPEGDSEPTIVADEGEVWESALPDGSGGGTTTDSGQLVINTGNDTVKLLEVQDVNGDWVGITADNTLVQGEYGELRVDMDGSWEYEIFVNTLDHPDFIFTDGDGDRDRDDQVFDQFATRVTDSDDDQASAILTIAVNDDGPEAVDDFAGTYPADTTVTYNVMANDVPGADDVTTLTGATLATPGAGVVIGFTSSGNITFDPNPNFVGTAQIDYTITDADNDNSAASLFITYEGTPPPQPRVTVNNITVPEGDDAVFDVNVFNAAVNDTLSLGLSDGTANSPADYDSPTLPNFQYSLDNGANWSDVSGSIDIPTGNSSLQVRTDTVLDEIPEPNETFNLTATINNADGPNPSDTGVATIIEGEPPEPLTTDGEVEESDMDLTQDAGELAASSVEGTVPAGPDESDIRLALNVQPGYTAVPEGPTDITGTGGHGIFQIFADNTYTYTLVNEADHSGPPVTDIINYQVTNGVFTVTNTLTIDIIDDAPIADDDIDSVASGATATGNVVTGIDIPGGDANTTDGDPDTDGADGWNTGNGPVVGVVAGTAAGPTTDGSGVGAPNAITTGLGTLTLNADGTYSYVALPNVGGTDTFTYTVQDDDGSTDFTTLTITVTDVPPEPINTDGEVEESDMDLVQDAGELAASSVEGTTPAGPDESDIKLALNLQPGFTAVAKTGTTPDGNSYQIFADGTYTYTLVNAADHSARPVPVADVIDYQVTNGVFTVTNTLTINILDDAPLTTDFGTNTNIFFHSEDAGYDNMVGVYKMAGGNPTFLEIIVHSTDALNGAPDELVYTTGDPDVKLFLVADGADYIDLNNTILRFEPGTAQLQTSVNNGNTWTDYTNTDVFFMDETLNPDGEPHFAEIPESQTTGENELPGWPLYPPALNTIPVPGAGNLVLIGIEDLPGYSADPDPVADHDFNDAVLYATEGFVVHEDGLESPPNPDAGTKAGDVSHPVSLTGNFFADGNIIPGADLPTTISVNGGTTFEMAPGGTAGPPSTTITSALGNELVIDNDGTWIYTLRTNTDHPDINQTEYADQVQDSFSIAVTDDDGSPAVSTNDGSPGDPTINLVININDDGPILAGDISVSATEGDAGPVTGDLLDGSMSGADGWASDIDPQDASIVTATIGGDTHNFTSAADSHLFNLGDVGSLTIEGDGDYSWAPGGPIDADVSATVEFTVQDGDGDMDSADLMLTLLDDGVVVPEP